MAKPFIKAEFDSLDACLAHIRKYYPDDQTCSTQARDHGSDEQYEKADAPAILYRGEPAIYETTKSFIMRLKEDEESNLSVEAKKRIEFITLAVNCSILILLESLKMHKIESLTFLQHYGLPTEIIDFTSKLDIAAHFAKDFKGGKSDEAVICVLPIPKKVDGYRIFHLTDHPFAERPRKQHAYGVNSELILDLKSDSARDKMKIEWFSFKKAPNMVQSSKGGFVKPPRR